MTTTLTHKQKVQELRSIIKSDVCKTLRVVMSKGSAWGNVKIKGSGEFGMFSEAEKSALSKHNFNYGANCGIIMYEDVDAVIARLTKQHLARTITGAGREKILSKITPADEGFAASRHETTADAGFAVLDDLVAAVKNFRECIGTASVFDMHTAEIKLDNAIAAAEHLRTLQTKTLKLSGGMVDATDRDLAGNPTLEGHCS